MAGVHFGATCESFWKGKDAERRLSLWVGIALTAKETHHAHFVFERTVGI